MNIDFLFILVAPVTSQAKIALSASSAVLLSLKPEVFVLF